MTKFQSIFDTFIIDIEDSDIANDIEDIYILYKQKLKSVLPLFSKVLGQEVIFDLDTEELCKTNNGTQEDLSEGEIDALGYWLIYKWKQTKLNNIARYENHLEISAFTKKSEANMLPALRNEVNQAYSEAVYRTQQINSSCANMVGRTPKSGR